MNTNITITIYDLLSYLFPGSALLLTMRYFSIPRIQIPDQYSIIYLVVFGFLVGALLHLIGLILFKGFYPEDYPAGSRRRMLVQILDKLIYYSPLLRVKKTNLPTKELLKDLIRDKLGIDLGAKRLELFAVADAIVANSKYPERELLMAKEGFFRSLVALVFMGGLYLVFLADTPNKILTAGISLVILEIFRYAREYYRTIKNQQIYMLALINLKS